MEYPLHDECPSVIIPGMAYLFKSKTTNTSRGARYRSKKWYGRWKTPSEKWVSRALSESKRTARKMLLELCTKDEQEGIRKKPVSLASLLEQFKSQIETSSTPDYARLIHFRASSVIKEIEARNAEHIEPSKVQLAVAKLADSLRTRNHYAAAVKQFCRWLVDNGHARRNPVAGLKPAKHDADKRYVRRSLQQSEWASLADATIHSNERFRGLDGQDRFMLYSLVLSTGWRAGGLAQLRVKDFRSDGLVVMEAKYSKNRREQRKFLPPPVHAQLTEYLRDKSPTELAFPGTWAQDAAEMLRIDLQEAGIKPVTEEGIMDFHAFRNTSITWLLEAGTPIYLVQKHADHASPAQTMRYARPKRETLDDAVESTFSHIISHKPTPESKDADSAITPIPAETSRRTKKAHGRTPVVKTKKPA